MGVLKANALFIFESRRRPSKTRMRIIKELILDFFKEPLEVTPGEGEACHFPLDSLEEGVLLGDLGGGVPPPWHPVAWLRNSLPNMMFVVKERNQNAITIKNE
ncbi:UNVERIFIED_CONTAM: hypothetical protein Sradi_4536800 [Sesamum radiatum]|uniref:Uncharacterized protein n=1 Tax=Sesamum radiatum TaxID=300843 RepID=A0AAW2N8X1_SESRA